MGKSTIVESKVTKKPLDIFNDDVDLDSSDYSDDTPVIIPLGKLRKILHEHIEMAFDDSTYSGLIEQFKD